MEYRRLGKARIKLSRICLGTAFRDQVLQPQTPWKYM
jgi:aryl-alcohol dehydrogenase-like predicted oxidoreductase